MATIMEKDVLLELANYCHATLKSNTQNWKDACLLHGKLLSMDYKDISYKETLKEIKRLEAV